MEPQNVQLCPRCTEYQTTLAQVNPSLRERVELAPDIWALQRSANLGCVLCQFFFQAVLYREPGILKSDWAKGNPIMIDTAEELGFSFYGDDENDSEFEQDPHQSEKYTSTNKHPTYLRAFIRDGSGCGLQKVSMDDRQTRPVADLSSVHGVESIGELARKWLSDCQRSHHGCWKMNRKVNQPLAMADMIPTRLVDVGLDGSDVLPKLVITNDRQHYSEYVTLSYAWGEGNTGIKTTFSNHQDLTRQIDYSKLPKTIQEAVLMTTKLGIRYLWVDSLCILQSEGPSDCHHAADWRREAERFGHYYENSLLTIAASGARCSSEGLFLERPGAAHSLKPYTVKCINSEGLRKRITSYPTVPDWDTEIKMSPLGERGWAAQERLLSRRILHFTPNCVCWECFGRQATEANPSSREFDRQKGFMYSDRLQDIIRKIDGVPIERITPMWYTYIQDYSRMKFSYLSDRLPALSTLARRVQSHIKQPYSEGIWTGEDVDGLTWVALEPFGPAGHEVPSWSWASVRGAVKFMTTYRLKGDWFRMSRIGNNQGATRSVPGKFSKPQTIHGRFSIIDMATLRLEPSSSPAKAHVLRRYSEDDEDDDRPHIYNSLYLDAIHANEFTATSLHCLLLGRLDHYNRYHPPNLVLPIAVALLLEPTGEKRGDVEEYKRIGLLAVPYDEHWSRVTDERDIDLV